MLELQTGGKERYPSRRIWEDMSFGGGNGYDGFLILDVDGSSMNEPIRTLNLDLTPLNQISVVHLKRPVGRSLG